MGYFLIAIGLSALRIACCIWATKDMLKRGYNKWATAVGCILLLFKPVLGLIYYGISRIAASKIRQLK